MIDFATLQGLTIPEGAVSKIERDGVVLWEAYKYRYVSLGDSIAAGHSINSDWESNYGEGSQYGKNGNTSTTIVANSYTDLIRDDLAATYGASKVSTKSFARSGDTVADLIEKLDHNVIQAAIKKANLVTICIGANDVLQPALSKIESYINTGNPALVELGQEVQANLDILNDDTNANSYKALFDKLNGLNPNAKYVFTTIYNPLKYLWLDESTADGEYLDGFLGPLMWAMPSSWGSVSTTIRGSLYDSDIVQLVLDRINGPSRDGSDGLAAWTETYVSKLNDVLRTKINGYGNSNFILADSKTLFESFPDRPVTADIHYNDLVNIEFTRSYKVEDMDWGQFWDNFSLSDVLGGDVMSTIMSNIVSNVIFPDLDPHPETYGHYAMKRAMTDVLGWESLTRYTITYNANGGTGAMASRVIVGIDNITAFTTLDANAFTTPVAGYPFATWNTVADGSGAAYADKGVIGLTSNITLYAQWSNILKLIYRHTNDSDGIYSDSDTGHQENYAMSINGTVQGKLSSFSNPAITYYLPYGTKIAVAVTFYHSSGWYEYLCYADFAKCDIYVNDFNNSVADNESKYPFGDTGDTAYYEFTLTSNTDIDFRAKVGGTVIPGGSAKAFWDCYITTGIG